MKHKTHIRIVEAILAIAFVLIVWVGLLTIRQASAANLGQAGPTATATSTDTPTPTDTSTPTNTPASWRHERGDRL
jgi:hypothetical protein